MPSLIDRLAERFGYLRADSKLPMVVQVMGERAERGGLYIAEDAEAWMKAYEQISWIYASVSRIIDAGAFVPFNVGKMGDEEWEEIVEHPFELLLRRPNEFKARYQLWENTIGFLKLTGNAYWYLNIVGGKPAEIWSLRPDWMSPVVNKKAYVTGWVYDVEGREVPLEAQEVVHFPLWHPRKEFTGLSPIRAGALAAEMDNAAAEYNRNFFGEDNAKPAGLVNIKEYVSDQDYKRIQKEWKESYGGTKQKTAFVRGSAVEWSQIGLSQEDMQWLEGRKFSQEEIMTGIYSIPPGLYRESATQANAKIAYDFFVGQNVWPMLVRLAEIVTARVLWPFYGKELEGRFEDIRPENREILIREMEIAMDPMRPLLTVDEARRRYFGFGPMKVAAPPEPEEEKEPEETEPEEPEEEEGVKEEIDRWERKARRWLKERGVADAPFDTATIPAGVAGAIRQRLQAAKTPEEVKAAFAVPFR